MKQKSEKCLYCDQKLEPKTTRQRFCSDKCRVYWNRDNAKIKVSDLTQPTGVLKPQEQPKSNYSVNTIQKPIEAALSYNELRELIEAATSGTELHKAWKAVERNKELVGWHLVELGKLKELQRTKIDF